MPRIKSAAFSIQLFYYFKSAESNNLLAAPVCDGKPVALID